MIIEERLVQELVAVLGEIREIAAAPKAGEEQFLGIPALCQRWGISRRQFHDKLRDTLPYAVLTPDGHPRFRLSDIAEFERRAMRRADGTPLHSDQPEKRPARRRSARQQADLPLGGQREAA